MKPMDSTRMACMSSIRWVEVEVEGPGRAASISDASSCGDTTYSFFSGSLGNPHK